MTELLHLENYSFTYPQQRRPALSHVTLTVPEGAFMVLCGPSGCGKSTLLRQLKTVLAPHGLREGEITFCGTPLAQIPSRRQAAEIGFVQQSPENQVVTDKVWHELAFGLESLGFDTPTIRRRVAEMASFFGIQDWFYKNVTELSGGQKQLLSLASVMVMQPRVLILDEPTSQLDPIAASDFLQTLGRINRELGTTVLLTEHRLEEALPLATHAAVMDGGRLLSAVLLRLLRRETCWRVMRIIGTAAEALLVVGGVVGAVRRWQGSWSLAAAGCFLLYSAVSATTSEALTELRALMDRKIRMETRGKLPIQPMAMLSTRTLHHAVRALHPTRMTQLYIIEPGTMRLLGILTEQQLIAAYLSAPQRTLAEEVDA